MKLYLKPTEVILVLALTLTASAAFSMDPGEHKSSSDVSEGAPLLGNSDEAIVSILRTSPLFSAEERDSAEIGWTILQDRIRQRQELLNWLKSPNIPMEDKLERFLCHFNNTPSDIPHDITQEDSTDEEKISLYCNYISSLLETYTSIKKFSQCAITADTQEEKDQHQNNLYYFLSFEQKYFEEVINHFYHRQIPEHLREDSFYKLICLKMCAKDTKSYHTLKEYKYIEISFVLDAIACPQVDNQKLYDHYESINQELVRKFDWSCPFFWLAPTHRNPPNSDSPVSNDIKKFSEGQLKTIQDALSECHREECKIRATLIEEVGALFQQVLPDHMKISFLYNESGPLVLKAIQAYEAVSEKIRKIEKNTIEWLKNFKGESKFYRTLSSQHKQIITTYLQEQNKTEIAKAQEATRAAAVAAAHIRSQRMLQKKQKKAEKPSTKEPTPPKALQHAREEFNQQEVIAPTAVESESRPDDAMESLASPVAIAPVALSQTAASAVQPESPVLPKVKIKTRRASSFEEAPVTTAAKDEEDLSLLPERLSTAEFHSFIQDLLTEKNTRKLTGLFNKLKDYGIFSETDERNNKGYFAVKSPITNTIHARTYHHLHADNPYGSVFIALREVLISADIIER